MIHKRMVQTVLEDLDTERLDYFQTVVDALEEDPRTEPMANYVYTVLKETMPLLPPYLPRAQLIDMLFAFAKNHERALRKVMYDETFVRRPAVVREITDKFVEIVVAETLALTEGGEIASDEPDVKKFTWPYRLEDVIDPEDPDDLDELERRRSIYTGPERRKR